MAKKKRSLVRKPRKQRALTGPCFMCKNEPSLMDDPAEGSLATGSRLDYGDTYWGGEHAGEYRRIVFYGWICDMHANQDDIVSIRWIR